jgi:hypothetical protein
MDRRDQPMSLSAPILGIQPDDGGDLTALTSKSSQDRLEKLLHASGGIAMPKEDLRIGILLGGRIVDDLGKVSSELLILGRTCLNICPRTAGLVNRFERRHSGNP